MTTPSSTSRLPRPSLARASPSSSSSFRYVSPSTSTSTSKPKIKTKARSGSHPKILPFPELSLRAQEAQRTSREGSRAASPMSSPPIDRLEVTFDQMVSMSRGGSSEGNGTERRTSGGGTGNTSAGSGLAGSTSPPVPSPLAVSAARLSRARARTAPSRARGSGEGTDTTSRESPSVTVGRSGARLNMPSPTPTSTPSRRTEGFRPASPALSRVTTNVHTTSNNSLLTTNTSTSSSNPRPVPTLLAPPTPVTPVTPAKHHTHPHTSHTTRTQSPQPPSSTSTSTSTVAIAPIPSSSHIKDHLYQSFLTGVCADVRLVVKKWGVCYHVHRMVLVQTSFFHTLFLGGFSENHPNMRRGGKGKGKARDQVNTDEEWNGDDVELIFDDPNITRAAFEICLSRLYSSHPHLQFPTDLLPTAAYPLTPSFPHIPSPDYLALRSSIPHKAQLVTPRLLLSLLATTIYLGHGAFMREVLASILRTVGPLTVGRYLSFALGDGIEDEEFPGQSEEGVKALSGIAKYIQNEEDDHDRSYVSRQTSDEDLVENQLSTLGHTPRSSSDSGTKIGDSSEESARHGGIPIPSLRLPSRSNSMRSTHTTRDDPFSFTSTDAASLPHYYGVVGNKIGEACCCWLARWGIDLLNAELETSSPAFTIWGHGGLPAKLVRAVISSDYFFVPGEMERYCFARKVLDLRRSGWDEDNEDAGDISLAASGTGLHEADESWEEWEEEEAELLKTFAEGIYYPHMTFDDLSTIAADIDPSTHLPYAPLSVLQAAHWAAADLRSRVTAHEKTGSPTTVDDENELGLTQTTTAICTSGRKRRPAPRSRVPSPAIPSSSTWGHSSPSSTIDSLPSLHSSQNTVWHAVPTDGTHKIGASGLLNQASSMQFTALGDMPDFGPDPLEVPFQASSEPIEKARPPPQGERTAFGLMGDKMTGKEIQDKWVNEGGSVMFSGLGLEDGSSLSNSRMAIGNGNEERWTKIEPYRFSVEFFDVDKLTEKERFYSSTHFYAGSYFNCYVQMIKRKEKGLQLGVYLHRQSPNEPFPKPSSPRRFDSSSTTSPLNSLAPPLAPPIGGSSPVTSHTRNLSTSPMVVPGSPPTTGFSPTSNAPASSSSGNNHDGAPYTDTRSTTKAFFSISCASALGTALIRFTSGPDSFALSQSWGWKSSALKSEEYLCVPTYEAPPPREEDGDGDGVLGWSGEVPSTNGRYGQCSLRATVVVGVV